MGGVVLALHPNMHKMSKKALIGLDEIRNIMYNVLYSDYATRIFGYVRGIGEC
jgi:hypothetical protein